MIIKKKIGMRASTGQQRPLPHIHTCELANHSNFNTLTFYLNICFLPLDLTTKDIYLRSPPHPHSI